MGDDGNFRRGIAGGVIMMLLGAANLGFGNLLLGLGGLAFGVAGLFAVVGLRRGWFPRRRVTTRPAAKPTRAADVRPAPLLSDHGKGQVVVIVAELHAAGVLVPDAPDPAHLYESVADYGEPVTIDAVLGALQEAHHYHPDFRLESCTANLVFHGTQIEQGPDYLREQIDDLVRLAGGALTVEVADIRQEPTTTLIRWNVNGAEQTTAYAGAAKYLSTVIHVTLARAMSGAPRRLASLWTDQGMWITTLPADLDADRLGDWNWVDEEEPMAAGDA